MKIKIQKSVLLLGLKYLSDVVKKKSTLPVLGHVLLSTRDGVLDARVTNLDMEVSCKLQVQVDEPGSVLLPVFRLQKIVKELPNEEVTFTLEKNMRCVVESGASRFKFPCMDTEEYPERKSPSSDGDSFSVGQEALKNALSEVVRCASTDENRYVLNGALVTCENHKCGLVATDGRRMAKNSVSLDSSPSKPVSAIFPLSLVHKLASSLGAGELANIVVDGGSSKLVHASLEVKATATPGLAGSIEITSKTIDAKYPNWKQVIPDMKEFVSVKIDREAMLESVSRVSLMASDVNNSIRLDFEGSTMKVSCNNQTVGESKEVMELEEGQDLSHSICLNPDYLKEMLSSLVDDEITLHLMDSISPFVVTSDSLEFLGIIMPLRLS
jgi:DNA polymerase-3 subunit beta